MEAKFKQLLSDISAEYERFGDTQYKQDWNNFEPATDDQIAALEKAIGIDLPEELKTFLKLNTVRHGFTGNFGAMTAEDIKREWEMMKKLVDDGTFDGWVERRDGGNWNSGQIKKEWWSTDWIPFAVDGCGNLFCVDTAPGPNGKVGQIMNMENQDGQGPYATEWDSLENFLSAHLQYMREGRVMKWGEDLEVDRYSPSNPEFAA